MDVKFVNEKRKLKTEERRLALEEKLQNERKAENVVSCS